VLPTVDLLLALAGFRPSRTSVTAAELALLLRFARGVGKVIEVGVFEGATSKELAGAMAPDGELILVDPYFRELKLERWLKFSATRVMARRSVAGTAPQLRWLEETSLAAAATLADPAGADLIFLDARHDYDSVLQDLRAWSRHVKAGGALAIHDCRPCGTRPELEPEAGGCLALTDFLAETTWHLVDTADSLAVIGGAGRVSSVSR
jgi:predicted O-methyltransferase YrrM